jgi:hypothetical protein
MRAKRAINADRLLGCYAYATLSGFRSFDLAAKGDFWDVVSSRWLFGIDYGRTEPRALREIAAKPNSDVRIYDGADLVKINGFMPRRDFHAKVALFENAKNKNHALVLGSGNFSHNGLLQSIEAGYSFISTHNDKIKRNIYPVKGELETLWQNATPLSDIIDDYEKRYSEIIDARDVSCAPPKGAPSGFWIEAGHVTKNRGPLKPGNQIFAPNGFRKFFGLSGVAADSTLIGEIIFKTKRGERFKKNYRENDNKMEKLTLPMPEEAGFGVYDGKTLIFELDGEDCIVDAIEVDEFALLYGHRMYNIKRMAGGRRYGEFI